MFGQVDNYSLESHEATQQLIEMCSVWPGKIIRDSEANGDWAGLRMQMDGEY